MICNVNELEGNLSDVLRGQPRALRTAGQNKEVNTKEEGLEISLAFVSPQLSEKAKPAISALKSLIDPVCSLHNVDFRSRVTGHKLAKESLLMRGRNLCLPIVYTTGGL